MPRLHLAAVLIVFSVLGLACSQTTDPTRNPSDGSRDFQGSVDPSARTFLLESIDSTTVTGVRIRVDLLGSNLEVNPETFEVALDVRVRNAGEVALYAPGEIVIHDMNPSTVWPENADRTECLPTMRPGLDSRLCLFAFDYSRLLGDDGVLSSGETSAAKRWRFKDPGLVGFSFGAAARFGLSPDRPRIEGTVFADVNANGHRDLGEPGFGGGMITANGPGLDSLSIQVPEDGHFMFPVTESGLYTLLASPPPTFAAVHATTPNPLQILLPLGTDGVPESYLHADFGFANDMPPPPQDAQPVGFWDGPEDSLSQDPYSLLDVHQDGTILELRVGYSGCQPEHAFGLFMLDGFVFRRCLPCPPLANIVLSHDGRGEMCLAYFERTLRYDLAPILRRYKELYGQEQQIEISYRTWNGDVHTFLIGPVTAG
jgi:hypothetical protein